MLPSAAVKPPATYPRLSSTERRQREHELGEAYRAAELLMERLELCIGSEVARHRSDVKLIRQALALELLALDLEVPA